MLRARKQRKSRVAMIARPRKYRHRRRITVPKAVQPLTVKSPHIGQIPPRPRRDRRHRERAASDGASTERRRTPRRQGRRSRRPRPGQGNGRERQRAGRSWPAGGLDGILMSEASRLFFFFSRERSSKRYPVCDTEFLFIGSRRESNAFVL
jgi:hypothetical protein